MTARSSWIVSGSVAVVVIAFLVWVASFRFAIPLVSPAPPVPDYSLQATIAVVGSVVVLACFVLTGITATRSKRRRSRTVTIGSLVVIAVGMLTPILAFTIPA